MAIPVAWRSLREVSAGDGALRRLAAGSDASYLYLALQLPPGRIGWDTIGIELALDTYLSDRGQMALPGGLLRSEVGFEFLVDLRNPAEAALRILPSYNPYVGQAAILQGDDYGQFYRRPATIGVEADGRFDPMFVITNRARFGRDGSFFPASGYDRGRLRYGPEASSSLADWYVDESAGLIEIRLPWGLLNVTDPSSRTVLFDHPGQQGGDFGTAVTDGFRIGAVLYSKRGAGGPLAALPAAEGRTWRASSFRTVDVGDLG